MLIWRCTQHIQAPNYSNSCASEVTTELGLGERAADIGLAAFMNDPSVACCIAAYDEPSCLPHAPLHCTC